MTTEEAREPITIAVTGLNAIDSPGPGMAVIRSLREGLPGRIRIIGLSYESLEPGAYLHDWVDHTYQIPYPSAGTRVLLERLAHIHDRERLGLLIPNFDAELPNFIRLAPTLTAMGIASFLPTQEQFDVRAKERLRAFGEAQDLEVPDQRVVQQVDGLVAAAEALGYPLVVKGRFYEAQVAHTWEQALKAFHQLSARWGLPVIAQRFIRGTEVNVAVLGDGEGNAVSIVPMRKLYITDKGKAWAGVTLEDDALRALAARFAASTRWRGGCELEIMRSDDGRLHIMEVNPRFPAWIYLGAAAGQNQPALLARMALGESLTPLPACPAGRMFIRYAWDHVTDISEFQRLSGFGEL
jgi:carbamoyl-phosphate synthase large subunit